MSFWRDRPTLVTGAAGFLGGHLVERLGDVGAEVVCLVRDWSQSIVGLSIGQFAIIHGDVTDQPLMERVLGEYEIETVFHLAAQTQVCVANRNPVSTFDSNVRGTWSVLEACRRSPKVAQVIVASSDKAYGEQPDRLPYTEETPLLATHPYDASKACADLLARSYAKTWNVPVCVTRCANLFGPGDLNWGRLIPGTIRSVLRGERPVIRSDGKSVRDYLYVKDAASAYMLLVESMANARRPELFYGEAFNFSMETRLSVVMMLSLILATMSGPAELDIRGEASHEIREQYLYCEKARQILCWRPAYQFDAALAETVVWYQEHLG